jgi:hypothetical protein
MTAFDKANMSGREFFKIIDHEDRAKPNGAAAPALDLSELCLSPAEWEAREIEPEDSLLGPFSTTTRTEISADTGLGKTMLGLALAHAMAIGSCFLHWTSVRPGRVLFVDGEMPQGLIKARLKIARAWFGSDEPLGRDKLCVLSAADFEDMQPLDTAEGARWLLDMMDKLGRFDHVTLDNRASLAGGDLAGDDASTTALKLLQRQITKLNAGQTWLHHTGLQLDRGYGRKSREWELDSVAVGERLEDLSGSDVAMRLSFKKSRRRTPENRADYAPIEIELREGQWFWHSSEVPPGKLKPLGSNQQAVFDAATKLLAGSTTKAPHGHVAGHRTVITADALKLETSKIMACAPKHLSSRFNEALNGLTSVRRLEHYDGLVWLP